uniref:Uncharacterized protein n=1 Tax=Marseillevirus LCMAC201 TaxID=2506605 RepID=A0A481YVT5_9VIRU|nr:MAG: hypothetical protein LCMAC201_00320 [Marseillevirus LCMAC201]
MRGCAPAGDAGLLPDSGTRSVPLVGNRRFPRRLGLGTLAKPSALVSRGERPKYKTDSVNNSVKNITTVNMTSVITIKNKFPIGIDVQKLSSTFQELCSSYLIRVVRDGYTMVVIINSEQFIKQCGHDTRKAANSCGYKLEVSNIKSSEKLRTITVTFGNMKSKQSKYVKQVIKEIKLERK